MTMFGKHHSEDTKAKMREAKLRNRNPMFGKHRYGSSAPFFGRKHSEETIVRLRNVKMGENNGMWKGDEVKPNAGRLRAYRRFPCPRGMERHHKDGNPLNNSPDNINFVTRKQHMVLDGRLDRLHEGNRRD